MKDVQVDSLHIIGERWTQVTHGSCPTDQKRPASQKPVTSTLSHSWTTWFSTCVMCVLLVSLLWAESEWMFLCHYKINYEPGEYHTKSDRGRQIYDVTYTESKNTDTWISLQNRNRLREWTHGYQGEVRGRDRLRVWGWHVHTTVFKTDNQQGPESSQPSRQILYHWATRESQKNLLHSR